MKFAPTAAVCGALLLLSPFQAALAQADAGADSAPRRLTVEQLQAFIAQAAPDKTAALRGADGPGDDSCRWAHDLECDEPGVGTGACTAGTDYSDCRFLIEGEADACRWSRDGECDEPTLGTGVCAQGSDRTDCAGVAHLRFRTDTCATAFNGLCEERGLRERNGPARCAPRTDRTDCFGRKRPLTINDAFLGFDDRQLLDTSIYPWNVIGALSFDDGSGCTGSLVAPDVVLTAAHCVYDQDGGVHSAGSFLTAVGREGGVFEAGIEAFLVSPRFSFDLLLSSSKLDATDWAYLRLDRAAPADFTPLSIAPVFSIEDVALYQAGYSWDTGDHLSGHLDCAGLSLELDGTLIHDCDMTDGDSGSPILIERDGVYEIVAIVSKRRRGEDRLWQNVAARELGFEAYLDDFRAGELGEPMRIAPPRSDK